jgi:hypothetical protein
MGLGIIDLEAAASGPYHAMEAATGGRRRRRHGCCSAACSTISESQGCFVLAVITVLVTVLLALCAILTLTYRQPSFSVHLTGYDGIHPGSIVSASAPSLSTASCYVLD